MPDTPLEEVLRAAETELQRIGPSPFSVPAFSALRDKISRYIAELVAESIKIARRHRADTVSAAHVEQAAAYLVADTSRKLFRHLGTIGGILLGAAIGNLLSMVTANQYSTVSIVVTSVLCIVGAFMIALHIAKD